LLRTLKQVFRSSRSRPIAEVIGCVNPILRIPAIVITSSIRSWSRIPGDRDRSEATRRRQCCRSASISEARHCSDVGYFHSFSFSPNREGLVGRVGGAFWAPSNERVRNALCAFCTARARSTGDRRSSSTVPAALYTTIVTGMDP